MTVLIVEDEAMSRARLARSIGARFHDLTIVGMTDSVASTVAWLDANPTPDIIFMDVELSDGNCFEIFRQRELSSQVIMTTAYDSYAIKAFETGSIDYLLKPYDVAALERAVGRCRERGASGVENVGALLAGLGLRGKKQYRGRIIVRIGERIIPVNVSDVACFYSEGKSNSLMTDDGKKYIIDMTIDSLDGELDPELFFRVSRGGIVSRKSVKSVTKLANSRLGICLEPESPVEMTVSRSRVEDFLSWLE